MEAQEYAKRVCEWESDHEIIIDAFNKGKQFAEIGFARTIADKLDVHISDEQLREMYKKFLENK